MSNSLNSHPTQYYPSNNNNNNVPVGRTVRSNEFPYNSHPIRNNNGNSNKNSAYGNGGVPSRRAARANLVERRALKFKNIEARIEEQIKKTNKSHANLNKELKSKFFQNKKTVVMLTKIYQGEMAKLRNLEKELALFRKRPELLMKWHAVANNALLPIHRRVAGKLPPTPSAAARKVWKGVAATVSPEQVPFQNIAFSPKNMAALTGLSENYIKKVNQIFGSKIPPRNKEVIRSLKSNILKSAANLENYRKAAERFKVTGVARMIVNVAAAASGGAPTGVYRASRANMQNRRKRTTEAFQRAKQAYLNYVTGIRLKELAKFQGIIL